MKTLRPALSAMVMIWLAACSGDTAPPASQATSPATDAAATAASSSPAAPSTPATAPAAAADAPPAAQATPPADTATADRPAASTAAPVPDATAYDVTCAEGAQAAEQCQVDKDTYIGWRTFAGQCQVCHGGSGLGSTFAPNLLDRLNQRVDHARFVEVVTNGYTGQVGAMPAWKGNPNVEPHIDRLYAYLKARADGVLPPGRPARKP